MTLSRSRAGGVSASAPVTSRRSSPTQRTRCGGSALVAQDGVASPELLADLWPAPVQSARNRCVRNQKCRASDLNSGVGMPVATTTRLARMLPASVKTSAVLRLKVTFFTGERSNNGAPRCGGRSREPEAGAIRIECRAVLGAQRRRPRRLPTSAATARGVQERARRIRPRAGACCSRLTRATCSGVDRHRHRRMRLEIALHVEPTEQRGEVERGAAPALPRPLARRARRSRCSRSAKRRRDRPKSSQPPTIRCCRGRSVAASSSDLHAGGGEGVCRGAAGEPAADDHYVATAAIAAVSAGNDRARASSELDSIGDGV